MDDKEVDSIHEKGWKTIPFTWPDGKGGETEFEVTYNENAPIWKEFFSKGSTCKMTTKWELIDFSNTDKI